MTHVELSGGGREVKESNEVSSQSSGESVFRIGSVR